jgi:hypothetical protein
MKIIIAAILTVAFSLAPTRRSQAQTVRDDSGGQYFLHVAQQLCGPRVEVRIGPSSAFVYLSGEYLEDRNLNAIARNLAIAGLNSYSESHSFYVEVQDSKGSGEAEMRR